MGEAVEFNVSGIKCDTPACDYNDPDVKVEDYENWVNRPCPKCGGNLLTQSDYDTVQMFIRITQFANQNFPAPDPDEPKAKVTVKLNGTGSIETEIEEV